jgi:hypothetical protein
LPGAVAGALQPRKGRRELIRPRMNPQAVWLAGQGSEDEQDHRDDDDADESDGGDVAGAHGSSEPVGIRPGDPTPFRTAFLPGAVAACPGCAS